MLILSPTLTIIVLAFAGLTLFVSRKTSFKAAKLYMQQQRAIGDLNGHIKEMINGQKVIKVFCHEAATLNGFDGKNTAVQTYGHASPCPWVSHSAPRLCVSWGGTIRDNIKWGSMSATDENICAAIRDAGLQELIDSLPNGMDTRVGEQGTQLSGGQRQRITIARAMIKNSDLMDIDTIASDAVQIVHDATFTGC